MIKTIIFDIGNVLMKFQWETYFKSFGFEENILKRVIAATVGNASWNEYDRGALSEEEMLVQFIENDPAIEKEIRMIYKDTHDILAPFDYAVPWIKDLKAKGYQVLVLSNFSSKALRECRDMMDFLDEIDGGILSFQEKVIKPEPKIYKILLERYQLVPEECVFLDDNQINLDAAMEFGIHTIHFTERASALKELSALGVK